MSQITHLAHLITHLMDEAHIMSPTWISDLFLADSGAVGSAKT
jgi:hypothetical protein